MIRDVPRFLYANRPTCSEEIQIYTTARRPMPGTEVVRDGTNSKRTPIEAKINGDFRYADFRQQMVHHRNSCYKGPNSKMWNCKHCWTKMIRKHENNSPSNWILVIKLFRIDYERWERFRRPVDGYHTSWTTANGKAQKRKWHFARSVQKEVVFPSYSYREWKLDLFSKSQPEKIMGRPRRTIHIDHLRTTHTQRERRGETV